MKLLVVDDDKDLNDLIVEAIVGINPDLEVLRAYGKNAAIELIKDVPEIGAVFCDFHMPDGTGADVFKFIQTINPSIKFVLVSTFNPNDAEAFKGYTIESIRKPHIFDQMIDIIEELEENNYQYSRIPPMLLKNQRFAVCDIFVEQTPDIFVKIIEKGRSFKEIKVQSFDGKGVEYFYFDKKDAAKLLNSLVCNSMGRFINSEHVPSSAVQLILSAISLFDVDVKTQQSARESLQQSIEKIKNCENIQEIIGQLQAEEESYIGTHSVVLSYLCCFIISRLNWAEEELYDELSMAALVHDVFVEFDDLAKLHTVSDVQNSDFPQDKLNDYIHHPTLAAEVINTFSNLSSEISTIVLQHHEQPDGSGFPNKIDAKKFTPGSAIFHVAHTIANLVDFSDPELSREKLFSSLKSAYRDKPFTKIVNDLEKSFN